MSILSDADTGWPKIHRRRPLSPGTRGLSANFYPTESTHPLRNAHNRSHRNTAPLSTASLGPNVSFALTENKYTRTSRHRSDPHDTTISGGIMSSVGGSQNIDTDRDHHNFKDASVQNNNYGINIHIHIHFGSGANSVTLTRVLSFGLFGRGDSVIMRWF